MLRCMVGFILFVVILQSLRLLRYERLFLLFGKIYSRAHRELKVLAVMLFEFRDSSLIFLYHIIELIFSQKLVIGNVFKMKLVPDRQNNSKFFIYQTKLTYLQILLFVLLLGFAALGHALFGAFFFGFVDMWSSIFTVSAILSGRYVDLTSEPSLIHATLMFIFFMTVFGLGLSTIYVSNCLYFIILCILKKMKYSNMFEHTQLSHVACKL